LGQVGFGLVALHRQGVWSEIEWHRCVTDLVHPRHSSWSCRCACHYCIQSAHLRNDIWYSGEPNFACCESSLNAIVFPECKHLPWARFFSCTGKKCRLGALCEGRHSLRKRFCLRFFNTWRFCWYILVESYIPSSVLCLCSTMIIWWACIGISWGD
jgi:hypothetical protein